jgi:hypothetical protein
MICRKAPPSNMSEKLTAKRAPFGQKPVAVRSACLAVVVAASALPGKPTALEATASEADAPTVWKASRRLRWEELLAELIITCSFLLPKI